MAPRGIEMLTHLEVLISYGVRKEEDRIGTNITDSSGIEELANLNSLRELKVCQLENVRGKIDAERAKFKDKQNIRMLVLYWEDLVANNTDLVLDGLQPHPNLKELKIHGFSGLKLPKWMASFSWLPNLVKLSLSNFKRCEELPALGMLPCLKVLWIDEMSSVKCLGEDFYYQEEESKGSGKATAAATTIAAASFLSLVELRIEYMRNLERWVTPPPPHNSFPILENLSVHNCNMLTRVPDLRLWTSLQSLKIMRCNKLKKSIPYDLKKSLDFIKEVQISY
ncbi:disease resistance protein RGA2-like [Papaver somniferum]|uniref:disease resistance protein RGA2-like n=1 Tax=Papaver somniferum TaxID=3469 RepID=UPI000E702C02|nr:disease resistance protein RGA2-like [Papaver somniferum]